MRRNFNTDGIRRELLPAYIHECMNEAIKSVTTEHTKTLYYRSLASASCKIIESTWQSLGNATGSKFIDGSDRLAMKLYIKLFLLHTIIKAVTFTSPQSHSPSHVNQGDWYHHGYKQMRHGIRWAWRIPALSCPLYPSFPHLGHLLFCFRVLRSHLC
jgi:hypothetical protein